MKPFKNKTAFVSGASKMKIPSPPGAGTPERVGRGTVFQFSTEVLQYTIDSGQETGKILYTP